MSKYEPDKIESKWQEIWQKSGIYKDYSRSKKFYALDMFPYPSGTGLHVGHPKGYIATDVSARFKMLEGYSVLHPMGWDAFGLPAENYAIKNKMHPEIAVKENIKTFKAQLEKFGFTYDWDREINTTDPEYYKWTQWIFLKMFEKGLAYESDEPINWCPSCKTGLALEDLEAGLCERCGSQVEQKKMRQWVLKMTDYADRLLEDLDQEKLDWEDSIIEQQKNWIGRSEGAEFEMRLKDSEEKINVYTTRLDTVFGMTYAVVAPEHHLIKKLKGKIENYEEVEKYIINAQNKTDLERTDLQKDKTGVELKGVKTINPFNDEEIPLFVADYVIGHYGTGAVMAVPAHDERDFEFAKKYDLPVKQVVAPLFLGEGEDKPIKSEPVSERNVAVVIVKHWDEDKYLCLDWENFGWKSFVIGGIENNENAEKAALRELKEETGYADIASIEKINGEIHDNFNARHKKIGNRYIKVQCFYAELKSGEQLETSDKDTKHHNYIWLEKKDVEKSLNVGMFREYWKYFLEGERAMVEDGVLINSGKYDGLTSEKAREEMAQWIEKEKIGRRKVNYKMRDWVFSRQRYWGEPIPIIHCEKCGTVGVPEKDLPVLLPKVEKYEPTGTGEGPLAGIEEWVNVKCPKCGGPAKRETNTMPQWAGSSWYYLRYIDPKNSKELVDKRKEKEWMPVDLYVGGAEHATRHLLYARFWHKFLFDIGAVSTKEPFQKLVHVGLINGEDGRKMSKRWGNVINPDEIIAEFGADSIRLYEMFMGPFTQNIAWSTKGVVGMRRFLEKIWSYFESIEKNGEEYISEWIEEYEESKNNKLKDAKFKLADTDPAIKTLLHKTIKKVGEDIEGFRFNTAISQIMIFINSFYKKYDRDESGRDVQITASTEGFLRGVDFKKLLIILAPFAPHIAEEIWEKIGHKNSIFFEKWPEYDPKLIKDEEITLIIQVNGKVRDQIQVPAGVKEDEAKKLALASGKVIKYIEGKQIKKIVFVEDRLINFVI